MTMQVWLRTYTIRAYSRRHGESNRDTMLLNKVWLLRMWVPTVNEHTRIIILDLDQASLCKFERDPRSRIANRALASADPAHSLRQTPRRPRITTRRRIGLARQAGRCGVPAEGVEPTATSALQSRRAQSASRRSGRPALRLLDCPCVCRESRLR